MTLFKKVLMGIWSVFVLFSFVAAGFGLLRIFIIDLEAASTAVIEAFDFVVKLF